MMTLGFFFWLIYIICLVFSIWTSPNFKTWAGGNSIFFLLIGLLGIAEFGWPVKG